jgi:hypothetical protein
MILPRVLVTASRRGAHHGWCRASELQVLDDQPPVTGSHQRSRPPGARLTTRRGRGSSPSTRQAGPCSTLQTARAGGSGSRSDRLEWG